MPSPVAPPDLPAIVRLLETLIVEDNLGEGDRLPPIRELARRFDVKPGTMRDALLAMQVTGVVKVLPRVGAIVQSNAAPANLGGRSAAVLAEVVGQPDQNLFHVLETREALELTMVSRAAERRELSELYRLRQILEDMAETPVDVESDEYAQLDVEFHLEIGRLSGNGVMTALLEVLLLEVQPHLARIRWSDDCRAETNASHARIYSALVAGDAKQVQRAVREHLRAAYDNLLDELREPPCPAV